MTATDDAVEVEMLRLPCSHLTARPARLTTMIQCPCGRLWQLVRKDGEWTAQDAENL